MPLKLIGTVILLVIVTIFCGMNIGEANRCDINLLFKTFHSVPAFLTVLISFLAGVLVMIPFTFGKKKLREQEKEAQKKALEEKLKAKEEAKAKKAEEKAKKAAKKNQPTKKEAVAQSSEANTVPKVL